MEVENATNEFAAKSIDKAVVAPDVISVANPRLAPPRRAADLLFAAANDADNAPMLYWDRSHYESPEKQLDALKRSSTVYVGNLSFGVRSRHVRAHFENAIGPVVRIQMGLDRHKKTPCGFCFVEYQYRADALAAVALLTNTKLDGKVIRVELDAGFQPGRQYGRGASGGQVRDDKRKNFQKDDNDRRNSEGSSNKRSRDDEESSTGMVDINAPLSAPRSGSHSYYGSDQGQAATVVDASGGGVMDEETEPDSKRRRT